MCIHRQRRTRLCVLKSKALFYKLSYVSCLYSTCIVAYFWIRMCHFQILMLNFCQKSLLCYNWTSVHIILTEIINIFSTYFIVFYSRFNIWHTWIMILLWPFEKLGLNYLIYYSNKRQLLQWGTLQCSDARCESFWKVRNPTLD